MTERIREFLRNRRLDGLDTEPCLVVDLEVVRDNYNTFARALPDSRVFYAVKANPAPEVLSLLASLGSCFDTATVAEIEMALAAGATPDRISYGNTIKKERDIARAFEIAKRIDSGICHVNGPTVHDEAQMPFGGVKASGYGRFGGKAGIAEFTELRWITIETGPQHYPI